MTAPATNPPQLLQQAQSAPILDYAGPQSRGRFRLPATSHIAVTRFSDAVRIRETLTGQAGAFFALVFALATLVGIVSVGVQPLYHPHWQRHIVDMSLCLTVATAELLAMLAVIDNTWRSTTLLITHEEIQLRFRSPLRGSTFHKWPCEKFRGAFIRHTRLQANGPEFPELELDLWGESQVCLFLGHRLSELQYLAGVIHQVQPPVPLAAPDLPNPPSA